MEVLQTSALPLGYGAAVCSSRGSGGRRSREKMERETGFEPATSTLARSHSTTELFPLALATNRKRSTGVTSEARQLRPCRATGRTPTGSTTCPDVPRRPQRYRPRPSKASRTMATRGRSPSPKTIDTTSNRQQALPMLWRSTYSAAIRAMVCRFRQSTASTGSPKRVAPPRLDLDEDQRVVVAGDDVDFSQPRPEAPGKDLVPLALELAAGVVFARFSEGDPIRRHRHAPEQGQGACRDPLRQSALIGNLANRGCRAPRRRSRPAPSRAPAAGTGGSRCGRRRGRGRPWRTCDRRRRSRSSLARTLVLAILDQLDADHQALAADVANQRDACPSARGAGRADAPPPSRRSPRARPRAA